MLFLHILSYYFLSTNTLCLCYEIMNIDLNICDYIVDKSREYFYVFSLIIFRPEILIFYVIPCWF